MSLAICYYHVVWAVQDRLPLLIPEIEAIAIRAVRRKSQELECPIYAINAVPDHMHVAVSILPRLAVSEWVRSVKGLSTREINAHAPNMDVHFHWQKGYSVHTFGAKVLPIVRQYIDRQKQHHADNTLEPYLERLESDE